MVPNKNGTYNTYLYGLEAQADEENIGVSSEQNGKASASGNKTGKKKVPAKASGFKKQQSETINGKSIMGKYQDSA